MGRWPRHLVFFPQQIPADCSNVQWHNRPDPAAAAGQTDLIDPWVVHPKFTRLHSDHTDTQYVVHIVHSDWVWHLDVLNDIDHKCSVYNNNTVYSARSVWSPHDGNVSTLLHFITYCKYYGVKLALFWIATVLLFRYTEQVKTVICYNSCCVFRCLSYKMFFSTLSWSDSETTLYFLYLFCLFYIHFRTEWPEELRGTYSQIKQGTYILPSVVGLLYSIATGTCQWRLQGRGQCPSWNLLVPLKCTCTVTHQSVLKVKQVLKNE